MRVLFTSPIIQMPPAGGPSLRILNSIKALNRVSELHVMSRASVEQIGGPDSVREVASHCKAFTFVPTVLPPSRTVTARGKRFATRIARRAMRAAGRHVSEHPAIAEAATILRYVRRHRIDVVWFGFGNLSHELIRVVRQSAPGLPLVCDTDSVWSRFILRELPFEEDPARREQIEREGAEKEAEERAWLDLCDVVTAVSEIDAEYYRNLGSGRARVDVFSNVIDLADYRRRAEPPVGHQSPSLCLSGTFGHAHSPMDRAARWTIEEVLPLVRREFPDLHFYLVGTRSDAMWAHMNDARQTAVGRVPSVLPYLCNAEVALVPLMFESGTRFKILEAGACHVPVVSTTLGAEGLSVNDDEHLLIADEPAQFAAAIVRLLRDRPLRDRLTGALHDVVSAQYSLDVLAGEGARILETLNAS